MDIIVTGLKTSLEQVSSFKDIRYYTSSKRYKIVTGYLPDHCSAPLVCSTLLKFLAYIFSNKGLRNIPHKPSGVGFLGNVHSTSKSNILARVA